MATTQPATALQRAKRQQQTRLSAARIWHNDRVAIRQLIVWLKTAEPMDRAESEMDRALCILREPWAFNEEFEAMIAEKHRMTRVPDDVCDEDRDALTGAEGST
jgi:hypothetical protein